MNTRFLALILILCLSLGAVFAANPVFTGVPTMTREYIVAGDRNYYDFNTIIYSPIISDADDDLNELSCRIQFSYTDSIWFNPSNLSNFDFNADLNKCVFNLNYEWGNTGIMQVRFNISDDADNNTSSADMNWWLDNTAPTTTAWFDDYQTIILTATDKGTPTGNGVGVKGIYYAINDGDWVYTAGSTATVTMTVPGDHHIYFYSMDNFDNNELRDNLSGVVWDKPFTVPGISPTGNTCNMVSLLIFVLTAVVIILFIYAGYGMMNDGINIQVLISMGIAAITFIIILFVSATVGGIMCVV